MTILFGIAAANLHICTKLCKKNMIKNIIFDFGGVIYEIDHGLSKKAFEDLGVKDFEQLYGHQVQTGLFEQLERGEISEQDFRKAIAKFLKKGSTAEQIDRAWCALLVGFDTKTIDLLLDIRQNYRIFLLSNTNIIHARRFIAEINKYSDFRSLFDDVWLSHEKQMRKPEKDFYLGLINKHDMELEKTLFIDDLDINIEAAKNLGIETYYLSNGQSVINLFKDGRLVLP
jgi:putative hydrolase of the HAD superfamily